MSAVIPVERPTVPNAEKASKSDWESVNSLFAIRASVLTTTAASAIVATAKACRWAWAGSRREKAVTFGSPRSSAQTIRASSASVVTLIPPPVEALPAPTNMRKSETKSVSSSIAP